MHLAFLLPLLTPIALSYSIDDRSPDMVEQTKSHYRLAESYNAITGEYLPSVCLKLDQDEADEHKPQQSTGGQESSVVDVKFFSNSDELDSELDRFASGRLGAVYGPFSFSTEATTDRDATVQASKNSVYLLISSDVEDHPVSLGGSLELDSKTLEQVRVKDSDDADTDIIDIEEFIRSCGTNFANTTYWGGVFYVVVEIIARDKREKKTLEDSFGGKLGVSIFGAEGEGQEKSKFSQVTENLTVNLRVVRRGATIGPFGEPGKVEDVNIPDAGNGITGDLDKTLAVLIQYAKVFSRRIHQPGEAIYRISDWASYFTLGDVNSRLTDDDQEKFRQARHEIDRLKSLELAIDERMFELETTLSEENVGSYYASTEEKEVSTTHLTNLTKQQDQVQRTIRDCSGAILSCSKFIKDRNLHEPEPGEEEGEGEFRVEEMVVPKLLVDRTMDEVVKILDDQRFCAVEWKGRGVFYFSFTQDLGGIAGFDDFKWTRLDEVFLPHAQHMRLIDLRDILRQSVDSDWEQYDPTVENLQRLRPHLQVSHTGEKRQAVYYFAYFDTLADESGNQVAPLPYSENPYGIRHADTYIRLARVVIHWSSKHDGDAASEPTIRISKMSKWCPLCTRIPSFGSETTLKKCGKVTP